MTAEIVKLRAAAGGTTSARAEALIFTVPSSTLKEFGYKNGDYFYVLTSPGRIIYQKVPDPSIKMKKEAPPKTC